MPDIFDQIHNEASGPAPAPAAGGDIFDQIHAQAAAPQTSEQFVNHDFGTLSPQERAAMESQRAHPASAPQQPGAIRNALTAGMHALEPLGELGVQAMGKAGLISPEREQEALNNQVFNPDESRLSAKVGAGLAPLALGPGAPLVMSIQAAENARRQNEAAIEAGQNPSLLRQFANTAGQAGTAYAMGKLMPGQKFGGAAFGRLPLAARALTYPVVGSLEAQGQNLAGNLIAKGTVNPKQNLAEGREEAQEQGLAFGAGGGALHEALTLLQTLRDRRAASAENPTRQPTSTPPVQELGKQTAEKTKPHEEANRPIPTQAEPSPLLGGLKGKQASIEEGTYADHSMGAEQPAAAEAKTPTAEPAEQHPARIGGGQPLADYVNRISGDNADIIGHMTANQDFVKARVPIDQLHNLGGTQEDVVVAKAKGPQKNPAVTLPSGAGGEGHLDVWDGNHAVEAARQRGDTHAEAYVPESMVGKNGIEPVRAADQTDTQRTMDNGPQWKVAGVTGRAYPKAIAELETQVRAAGLFDPNLKWRTGTVAGANASYRPGETVAGQPRHPFITVQNTRFASDTALHEYGHHVDWMMGGHKYAGPRDEPYWSDAGLQRWMPDATASEKHEYMAHAVAHFIKHGSLDGLATPPVSGSITGGRDALRSWLQKQIADQTAHTSQQVQTERPQMFGARKGTVAVPDALNKLVQRDVAPAVSRTASNAKASLDAVNRFVGTGLNLDKKGRDTAISLRESEAEHEVHQARMETELKPYRDELEKLTPDERAQWVDAAEQHGMSGHPKMWGLEIQNREWNKANAEEGKEYGLNTDKWKADWIGRLATFPQGQESGPGGKTRGSIAGSQKFRLARDYDTFSEFKKAVEDAGGKLKYENPADMLLAKQMEVRRSIEARKQMYQQEKAGQLTWRPDSEKSADEQHDTKLDDPLAKQTRDVVAPKWMVAKLLNLPHAEAEKYLQSSQWKNKSQTLRPGDELPQGYAKSGEQVAGTYHADANTAGLFNNLISKGFEKSVPVLSQIADMRRRVTALNLAVPTAHAALTTVSNSVSQFGLAMEAANKGYWDLAVKNAYRAVNPAAAARFGGELREQAANPAAHPELEPTVQTSMKGGNKFDLKSVLNETAYQKAKTEWEAGNQAGAVGRGIKAVYHTIEAPLFEKYIPNIKAAAKGAAAEIAVRDGLTGKELSRKMALAQDNVDNLLGMVKRSHQFQNRILTDLQDVVFTAPKFAEGTFRFAGAVGRDTFSALKDIASGKKPTMTPAMYSAAAGILTHMAGSALMQLAYTTATTGKAIWPSSLEDYYKPRTGRKDDAGRDERVSILSPFSALFSLGEHGVGSVTGRVAGLWKAAKAEMTGVDEQGRKLEGVSGRLGYAGKQLLPYSVQNLMDQKKRGDVTPDKVAGSMLGMHFGHEGATPAERAAWDVIHAHYQQQPRGQEEADKSDAVQKLVHEEHTHDPKTTEDIQKALKDGVISTKDLSAIRRRAAEKPGLAGLLHSSEIDAKSLMSDVWPKMTPDERKQFRLVVRGKIGRSSLPYAQKQELWKQTDQ